MTNNIGNEPNFVQAFSIFIKSFLDNIHTAIPAIVTKYDYTKQKAHVKPQFNRKFSDGTVLEMPIITNVPVIFPSSGEASLIFPVKKGDAVLLIIAERSIDDWLLKSQQITPSDPRTFDLSDAIAIPGLMSFDKTSQLSNPNKVELTYKNFKISIDQNGKIAIGISGFELLSILSDLLQALIRATTITVIGAQPLSISIDGTLLQLLTKLSTIKGTL
jgi:hypothetical protein